MKNSSKERCVPSHFNITFKKNNGNNNNNKESKLDNYHFRTILNKLNNQKC